jgi:hypothetical protein
MKFLRDSQWGEDEIVCSVPAAKNGNCWCLPEPASQGNKATSELSINATAAISLRLFLPA